MRCIDLELNPAAGKVRRTYRQSTPSESLAIEYLGEVGLKIALVDGFLVQAMLRRCGYGWM
jgi:hypothetical protein